MDLANCIEKSGYKNKILIEILLILSFGGLYYSFDMTISLYEEMKDYFSEDEEIGKNFSLYYNRLYGAMAWPNIVMPFIIGALADVFGNRILLQLLTIFGLIGQLVMWIGCAQKSIWTMIIGRIFSGVGIASILSLSSKFITPYYMGDSLAFVLSLNISIGLLFDSTSVLISPIISRGSSIQTSYLVAFIISIVAFVAQIFCNFFDIKADRHAYHRSLVIEQETGEKIIKQKIPLLRLLKTIPLRFWLVVLYFFFFFSSYLTLAGNFVPIAASILFGKSSIKNLTDEQSQEVEIYAFVALITPSFLLPIFGRLIDNFGGHCEAALISTFFCALVTFGCYEIHPLGTAIIMGISYSMILSSVWTTIPYLVKSQQLGMCYGIIVSAKFTGLTLFTLLAGYMSINDEHNKRQYQNLLYVLGSLLSVCFLILIIFRKICIRYHILNYELDGSQQSLLKKNQSNSTNYSIMSEEND